MTVYLMNKHFCSELAVRLAAFHFLNPAKLKLTDLSESLSVEVREVLLWIKSFGSELSKYICWQILIEHEN